MCTSMCSTLTALAAPAGHSEQQKLISISKQTLKTWTACNACHCISACLDSGRQPLGAARCAVLSMNNSSTSAIQQLRLEAALGQRWQSVMLPAVCVQTSMA